MAQVRAFNIDYDTDGEVVKLPKSIVIDLDEDEMEDIDLVLADYISDVTGWCVNSFNYELL